MIKFEPYIDRDISVLQNGEDIGLLVGTLFSNGHTEYVFEPDGADGDHFKANDLRQIAAKLDELNGVAND